MNEIVRLLRQPTLVVSVPKLEGRVITGRVPVIFLELSVAQSLGEIVETVQPVVVFRVSTEMAAKKKRLKLEGWNNGDKRNVN